MKKWELRSCDNGPSEQLYIISKKSCCSNQVDLSLSEKCRIIGALAEHRGNSTYERFDYASLQGDNRDYPHADMAIVGLLETHAASSAYGHEVKSLLAQQLGFQLSNLNVKDVTTDEAFTSANISQIFINSFAKTDQLLGLNAPLNAGACVCLLAVPAIVKGRGEIDRSERMYCITLGDVTAWLGRYGDVDKTGNKRLHYIPLSDIHRCFIAEERERIFSSGGTVENGQVNGLLHATRILGNIGLKRFGVSCTPTLKSFVWDSFQDVCVIIGSSVVTDAGLFRSAIDNASQLIEREKRRLSTTPEDLFDCQEIANKLLEGLNYRKDDSYALGFFSLVHVDADHE